MRRGLRRCLAATSFALTVAQAPVVNAAPATGEADSEVAPAEATPAKGPPAEDAPAKERAKYWFERGYVLATAKSFVAAGEAFDRSFAAIERPDTLFNAALAYDQGQRPIDALARYHLYLERFADKADKAAVERAVVRLEAALAEVSVRLMGAEPPVSIEINGETYGPDEFPVWFMPGEVEVVVIDGNNQRRSDRLLLRPGQRRVLEMTFVQRVVPGSGTPEGPDPDPGPTKEELRRRRIAKQHRWAKPAFVASTSLAAAGAIGWGTFGALTLRARKRFEDGSCGDDCGDGSSHPFDAREDIPAYRTTTNVMIGVAGAGAALGLTFGLLWQRSEKVRKAEEGRQTRDARVRLRPSASGVTLSF